MKASDYKARLQQNSKPEKSPEIKQNTHLPKIPMYEQVTKQLWDAMQGDVVWQVMQKLGIDKADDRAERICMEGRSLKVTPKVLPHLYELFNGVKERLHFDHPIDFFIVSSPNPNACAHVVRPLDPAMPYIVEVYSAMIEIMTDQELCSVVGHEIGHLFDDNYVLNQMMYFLFGASENGYPDLPIPLRYKYFFWKQLTELFADRYGYLATGGDIDACISAELKLKSGLKLDKMETNISAFIEENREALKHYVSGRGLSLYDGYTHPVSPIRIEALHLFANAQTEQELDEGMTTLINAISRLNANPLEDELVLFMAAGGMIMANVDGKITEKEYEQILGQMSNYHMFPISILNQVTPENCSDVFNNCVANILEADPKNANTLFLYLVNILVSDHKLDDKELDLLFQMGKEAMRLDDRQMTELLAEGMRRFFIPAISSLS